MSQPFLNLLEVLGRLGVSFGSQETKFNIGKTNGTDSENDMGWFGFKDSRQLWETWGPIEGSPWLPFHCVTLFAAVDEHKRDAPAYTLGPEQGAALPDYVMQDNQVPQWAKPGTLVIVDLPGSQSVALGYLLARYAGYQPVCTFDNWPHQRGALRTEQVLGTLLYYASAMDKARYKLLPESPPVWLCDRERFTGRRPSPGGFDNRYIIEDRLLPGPQLLRRQGIRRVIYVCPVGNTLPAEDLRGYLDELTPRGAIGVTTVAIDTAENWQTEKVYVKKFAAGSGWSFTTLGMMRSSAGGFGGFVPQPSSGGG